jgi:hypothetical protein
MSFTFCCAQEDYLRMTSNVLIGSFSNWTYMIEWENDKSQDSGGLELYNLWTA